MPDPQVWVMLTEDRHCDADAEVFATEEAAIGHAESYAVSVDAEQEELTEDMARAGWVRCYSYGESGFRVLRREVKA